MQRNTTASSSTNLIDSSLKELFNSFIETLKSACSRRFTFLLVGRTGVGKSSTVNSLLGKKIARVNDFEPETMTIASYNHVINDVKISVIDTPGLCDEVEEAGNDQEYLELMKGSVKQLDMLWFVSPLNDTRVRSDEKRGIKLISEAFSPDVWKHAVIIFTFADKIAASEYKMVLEKRTELIQKEIAKYTGDELARNIPSVAVANRSISTPDGNSWLAELYSKVFTRVSEKGAVPFLIATAPRVKTSKSCKSSKQSNRSTESAEASSDFIEDMYTEQAFDLNDEQKRDVRRKISSVIPVLEKIGEAIGAVVGVTGGRGAAVVGGAIGKKVGGAVGHAIDFIGSLFDWF